jgi:hypothetical protein
MMKCVRCGRSDLRAAYHLKSREGTVVKCLRCALIHPALNKRAFATALIVGSVLTAINQLDVLLEQPTSTKVWMKVGLTFVVPYCVTTWGALSNSRHT